MATWAASSTLRRRRYGVAEPYEKLKGLTRGKRIDKDLLHEFIVALELPEDAKARLLALTPAHYIGLADKLAGKV